MGILDFTILPLFLFFYFRAPVQRIADTALLMNAYGRDGEAWKRRLLRQYWQPPVIFTGLIVGTIIMAFLNIIPPHLLTEELLNAVMFIWAAMLFLWPLVFCIRANRAYFALEEWRQSQIEHRIAAGMASSADYHGYIQAVKEREYNRGYSDGDFMAFKW